MSNHNSQSRYDIYSRNPKAKKFYNSKLWKKKRLDILQRDCNLCLTCERQGIIQYGNTVHHIHELLDGELGWELRLDDDNLETICDSCHTKLHKKKDNVDSVEMIEYTFDDEGNMIVLKDIQ